MKLSMKFSFLTIVVLLAPSMALPGDIHHRYRFFEIPPSIPIPAPLPPITTGAGPVRHGNQASYYHRMPFNATVPVGTAIGTAAPTPSRPPTTASRTSSSMGSPSLTACPSRITAFPPIVTGDTAAARKRWALRRGHPEGACPGMNSDDISIDLLFDPDDQSAAKFPISIDARAI